MGKIGDIKMDNQHKETSYIVWVGGIDDHYTNLLDAELALEEWKLKGYDDVQLEIITG